MKRLTTFTKRLTTQPAQPMAVVIGWYDTKTDAAEFYVCPVLAIESAVVHEYAHKDDFPDYTGDDPRLLAERGWETYEEPYIKWGVVFHHCYDGFVSTLDHDQYREFFLGDNPHTEVVLLADVEQTKVSLADDMRRRYTTEASVV
jgi:hypothetical protein